MSSSFFNKILIGIFLAGLGYGAWDFTRPAPTPLPKQKLVVTPKEAPKLEVPKDPFAENEMPKYQQILVNYSTGNFAAAVETLEKVLESQDLTNPFRDWLTRQWPILMTSLGWMKIKTQDCDEASKIFYKVLSHSPVPEAQKGLGFCLRVVKNWPEAASYLAAYVLANPKDVEGRFIYADTLESLGRFDEAVTILEGAETQTDVEHDLKVLITERLSGMKAKSKSGAKQKTERSEHFYVSYREEDHDVLLPQVLEVLEAGLLEYSELLGVASPSTPIEVILYRKEEFHNVIPGGPGWAEGVFDGRMRVPVDALNEKKISEDLVTVLRHELSHAILSIRSNGRSWPTWFDEGLAQYLACRKRNCDQFQFPATIGTFSEPNFLINPFVTLDSINAGRAYIHSLYLVRTMVRSRGESVLDMISTKLAPTGVINSDYLAETASWESFEKFWNDAAAWWKSKEKM